jgi:hypothetical protein
MHSRDVPLFVLSHESDILVLRPIQNGGGFELISGKGAQALIATLKGKDAKADPLSLSWLQCREPLRFGAGRSFALGEENSSRSGSSSSLTHASWSRIVEFSGETSRSFPLPQSTYDQFESRRLKRVKDGYSRDHTEIAEEIGPYRIVGNRLWFGKHFYDGEGTSGIGGFGYFDTVQRKYVLISPPETADWSVSALLVEGGEIWMGLISCGEGYGVSGGLLHWDISTQQARRYKTDSIIDQIDRYDGRLYLATDDGVAVLEEGKLRRYMIDKTPSGSYRIIALDNPKP